MNCLPEELGGGFGTAAANGVFVVENKGTGWESMSWFTICTSPTGAVEKLGNICWLTGCCWPVTPNVAGNDPTEGTVVLGVLEGNGAGGGGWWLFGCSILKLFEKFEVKFDTLWFACCTLHFGYNVFESDDLISLFCSLNWQWNVDFLSKNISLKIWSERKNKQEIIS